MLLILTRGIFLHFPHYQKSGNLSTLLLAHLILLATKTLSSAATRLVRRRHTVPNDKFGSNFFFFFLRKKKKKLLPNLSLGRHTQGRAGLRDILHQPKKNSRHFLNKYQQIASQFTYYLHNSTNYP